MPDANIGSSESTEKWDVPNSNEGMMHTGFISLRDRVGGALCRLSRDGGPDGILQGGRSRKLGRRAKETTGGSTAAGSADTFRAGARWSHKRPLFLRALRQKVQEGDPLESAHASPRNQAMGVRCVQKVIHHQILSQETQEAAHW